MLLIKFYLCKQQEYFVIYEEEDNDEISNEY